MSTPEQHTTPHDAAAETRTREIAASLAAKGVQMVDCPVSGGVPRAKTGELAIMAGGDDAALAVTEQKYPVEKARGRSTKHDRL